VEKEPSVPVLYEAAWAKSRPRCCEEEKIAVLVRNRNPTFGCPAHAVVTQLTELSRFPSNSNSNSNSKSLINIWEGSDVSVGTTTPLHRPPTIVETSTIHICKQLQQYFTSANFHFYPILPTTVFTFMYLRFLIRVHTKRMGAFLTNIFGRGVTQVGRGRGVLMTSEPSFLASRSLLRRLFDVNTSLNLLP
jgi:hypothetical protein